MSASLAENIDNMTISQLFDEAWTIQLKLEKVDDTKTNEFRTQLKKSIEYLEKCDIMIQEIHLFSDNEAIEEISTKELRYFLYPALLGWLISSKPYNQNDRINDLNKSAFFYIKFLKLTKNYGLHNYAIPSLEKLTENNENEEPAKQTASSLDRDLIKQAYERNEKIKRFKETKEFEKKLEGMKAAVNLEHVDDERKRDFYLTFIKFWLNKVIENIKSVVDEMKLVKSRSMGIDNVQTKPKAAPIQPYILTRDKVQAQVFGAGYPSLPVYTVEEFYDQLAAKGYMPEGGENQAHHDEGSKLKNLTKFSILISKNSYLKGGPVRIGGGVTDKQKEEDKIEKERLEELDDEEELKKQREWDDWKDDHKRGEGNRFNRS